MQERKKIETLPSNCIEKTERIWNSNLCLSKKIAANFSNMAFTIEWLSNIHVIQLSSSFAIAGLTAFGFGVRGSMAFIEVLLSGKKFLKEPSLSRFMVVACWTCLTAWGVFGVASALATKEILKRVSYLRDISFSSALFFFFGYGYTTFLTSRSKNKIQVS